MKKLLTSISIIGFTTFFIYSSAYAAGTPLNGHTVTVTVSPNPATAGALVTATMSCTCDDTATSECNLSWTWTGPLTVNGNSASGSYQKPGLYQVSASCNDAYDSVGVTIKAGISLSSVASYYMVNETGIAITATIEGGVSGISVNFSGNGLSPSNGTVTTQGGVAIWNVSAGSTASSSVDGSSVTATYTPPAMDSESDTKNFSIVDLSLSPTYSAIAAGGLAYSNFETELTATASPAVSGVPVTFEFKDNSEKGVVKHAALLSPDSSTDSSGQAKVTLRSRDMVGTGKIKVSNKTAESETSVNFCGPDNIEIRHY